MEAGLTHTPSRPDWSCCVCFNPWPCGTAREELVTAYADNDDGKVHWASLNIRLALHLADACREQPTVLAGVLYHRFLGWIGRYRARDWASWPAAAAPNSPPPGRWAE